MVANGITFLFENWKCWVSIVHVMALLISSQDISDCDFRAKTAIRLVWVSVESLDFWQRVSVIFTLAQRHLEESSFGLYDFSNFLKEYSKKAVLYCKHGTDRSLSDYTFHKLRIRPFLKAEVWVSGSIAQNLSAQAAPRNLISSVSQWITLKQKARAQKKRAPRKCDEIDRME